MLLIVFVADAGARKAAGHASGKVKATEYLRAVLVNATPSGPRGCRPVQVLDQEPRSRRREAPGGVSPPHQVLFRRPYFGRRYIYDFDYTA